LLALVSEHLVKNNDHILILGFHNCLLWDASG